MIGCFCFWALVSGGHIAITVTYLLPTQGLYHTSYLYTIGYHTLPYDTAKTRIIGRYAMYGTGSPEFPSLEKGGGGQKDTTTKNTAPFPHL